MMLSIRVASNTFDKPPLTFANELNWCKRRRGTLHISMCVAVELLYISRFLFHFRCIQLFRLPNCFLV